MLNLQFLPLTQEHCPAVADLYIKTYAASPWFEKHEAESIIAFTQAHLANHFFSGKWP